MKPVTIYTTRGCGYCHRAKALLARKGVSYSEIDVTFDDVLRAEMTRKAGGRTSVPQIWIGDRHVGGSDDLYGLEHAGQLAALLAD
jgi:glutaredoxin 3